MKQKIESLINELSDNSSLAPDVRHRQLNQIASVIEEAIWALEERHPDLNFEEDFEDDFEEDDFEDEEDDFEDDDEWDDDYDDYDDDYDDDL